MLQDDIEDYYIRLSAYFTDLLEEREREKMEEEIRRKIWRPLEEALGKLQIANAVPMLRARTWDELLNDNRFTVSAHYF